MNSVQKVWAIGGGKGGIGKSFIISSLAITLAKQGRRVIIADLDLGGANLHTCFGGEIPQHSLSDFLNGRLDSLEKLLINTSVPSLSYISGAMDSLGIANISHAQHQRLMKALKELPCDYLLIDLGAGTHETTLDYFLLADKALIGITPEPTSIENAYRFVKSSYFRWIKTVEERMGFKSVVDQVMDQKKSLDIRTPHDLIKKIIATTPSQGEKFKAEVEKFKLHIILNQVRTLNDVEIGENVKTVCKKYFGIDTYYVGHLDHDNTVWQAVRKHRPLILEYPYSPLVIEFNKIVRALEENERPTRAKLLRVA